MSLRNYSQIYFLFFYVDPHLARINMVLMEIVPIVSHLLVVLRHLRLLVLLQQLVVHHKVDLRLLVAHHIHRQVLLANRIITGHRTR